MPNHELEEGAEKLAPMEEGAQEEGEGEGSDLFGESQDDENDVEVDGEMVFEEDLEEALLLQLFMIQERPQRKRSLSTP